MDLWFLRGPAIPAGGVGADEHIGQISIHPKPKQTQPAQIHRVWVCRSVGLWVFVLFFWRIF